MSGSVPCVDIEHLTTLLVVIVYREPDHSSPAAWRNDSR